MANILDQIGGLADVGTDALLTLLSSTLDHLSSGAEFTADQVDRLASIMRSGSALLEELRDMNEPAANTDPGATDMGAPPAST